jgi:hypothetical protein
MQKQIQGHKQTLYAVRVLAAELQQLRPVISMQSQPPDYIASLFRFEACPLDVSLEKKDIVELFQHVNWRCKPLVPKPGTTNTWIIASEIVPNKLVHSFSHGDVVLTPIIDSKVKHTMMQTRTKSNASVSSNDAHMQALEHRFEEFVKKQENTNQNIQACIQQSVTGLRTEIQQEIRTVSTKVESLDAKTSNFETALQDIRNLLVASFQEVRNDLKNQQLPQPQHTHSGRNSPATHSAPRSRSRGGER